MKYNNNLAEHQNNSHTMIKYSNCYST